MEKICIKCKELREHKAKGLCEKCYRKLWQPKLIICKRCRREMPLQAKELCRGCYNFVFQLDNNRAQNYKKWHNINVELYKKVTERCVICSFDKVVDLHHLSENKQDSSEKNLIGLCPNHHRMIHDFRYRKEMRAILKEKGYILPEDKKLDFELS